MHLRKATMRDIPQLLHLINSYAGQGVMLPRTEFELAEGIRDFVVYDDGRLRGCGALHFYTSVAAEVRSLAVDPTEKGRGIGRALMEHIEAEADEFGIQSLFAFTYVPDFFKKMGYDLVDRGLLPQKAWKDCLRCPKFQNCDEIAVRKVLREEPVPMGLLRVLPADGVPPHPQKRVQFS
ncbi:MAG: N-acetyltransferase [Acidobacteria bacterium]|nr:N-acetyltransferase [Acidobacteriota bacterium]